MSTSIYNVAYDIFGRRRPGGLPPPEYCTPEGVDAAERKRRHARLLEYCTPEGVDAAERKRRHARLLAEHEPVGDIPIREHTPPGCLSREAESLEFTIEAALPVPGNRGEIIRDGESVTFHFPEVTFRNYLGDGDYVWSAEPLPEVTIHGGSFFRGGDWKRLA